jgi:hypothetical protein
VFGSHVTLADVSEPQTMTQVQLLQRFQTVLESLFPKRWLEDVAAPAHPALFDWQLCRLLISQGGAVSYPSQRLLIPHLGRILLDIMTWLDVAPGSTRSHLRLGDIAGYGDAAVTKKINSRVLDPRGYSDLLVELMIGGRHRSQGDAVTPYEVTSYPDLRVDAQSIPLFIECKRVSTTSESRIRKVIQKANKQIKSAARDHGASFDGVVVLDLNGVKPARFGSSEWTPSHVRAALDATQAALSGEKNRSVRQALVVWDDFSYAGKERNATIVFYMRRCVPVTHSGPVVALDSGVAMFNGSTTAHMLFFTPKG